MIGARPGRKQQLNWNVSARGRDESGRKKSESRGGVGKHGNESDVNGSVANGRRGFAVKISGGGGRMKSGTGKSEKKRSGGTGSAAAERRRSGGKENGRFKKSGSGWSARRGSGGRESAPPAAGAWREMRGVEF